jgi:probable addiction module antidote protein
MSKRTIGYKSWLTAKLSDPDKAARFLNAAQEDSPAMFFKALRKVAAAQSMRMTELAESAGVSRESLYRMTSEESNPTYSSLDGILKTLGFRLKVEPIPSRRGTQGTALD